MALTHQFGYSKPKDLAQALEILSKNDGSMILSGGTDLVVMIKDNLIQPRVLVDLKGIESLRKISLEDGILRIGSGVTFTDLIGSKLIRDNFPVIPEMARTVASVGIRNRATVAGNICSGVPCMDSGPLLYAFEATISVAGPGGNRVVAASDWFVSPRKTAIGKNEIVTGISIPRPPVKHAGCWVKLGRYRGEDLAQVNLIILALMDGTFRISFGAVAPVPVRARRLENLLNLQPITAALIDGGKKLLEQEIKPITDIRASKEYRMEMAKVMFARGVRAAIGRLHGEGPSYGTSVI